MIASALGISCLRSPSCRAVRCRGRNRGQWMTADLSAFVRSESVSVGKQQETMLKPEKLGDIMAREPSETGRDFVYGEDEIADGRGAQFSRSETVVAPPPHECDCSVDHASENIAQSLSRQVVSTVGRSTNIKWHECPVNKVERQALLGQKGCIIWITGLSGSGKSTLASALSRKLFYRGHLSYVLDGDNLRHGLNSDLSFSEEDRAENVRRFGEVAKLFADSGVICIASLISPYRKDRDACRALLPDGYFIEVFMDMPLQLCEERDVKGLYKLARRGQIKGFTGVDDPYEPPLNCEIVIRQKEGVCPSPADMAELVLSYMEVNGYLHA